jgi:hypothetical protein
MRTPYARSIAIAVMASAALALAVASNDPPAECAGRSDSCKAPASPTGAVRVPYHPAIVTLAPTTTLVGTPPLPVAPSETTFAPPVDLTPSPEPPTAIPTRATTQQAPLPTGTWTPPPPDQLRTPRPEPTGPSPTPRPRLPVAGDIKLGVDGKYRATVDACTWTEYGRFEDATQNGDEVVGLQSACLPDEAVLFDPKTKHIEYVIQ